MPERRIPESVLAVVALYGIGLLLLIVYFVRDVLIITFIAWIIAAALRPASEFLNRRLPKALSILIPYLILLGALIGLGVLVVPPFVAEFRRFGSDLPEYIERFQGTMQVVDDWLTGHGLPSPLRQGATQFSQYAQQATMTLIRLPLFALNVIIGTFAVVAIGFYWQLERDAAVTWLSGLVWPGREARARDLFDRGESQMGSYVRGLAVLAFAVGSVTSVGLLILQVPYIVVLGVTAGILELLPTIGPIISAIPAILVALTVSPVLAIGVAVLYFAVQQLENYILVPRVHHHAVGLPPLVILLAVLVGTGIGGIPGAILSVPVAALLALILEEIRAERIPPSTIVVETASPVVEDRARMRAGVRTGPES